MKTMSDFIMEQDVVAAPVAEVTDVEIMESFMKMNAVAAVVDCYVEHAAIASFAESENLNVFACGQVWNQVIELEDETYFLGTVACKFLI